MIPSGCSLSTPLIYLSSPYISLNHLEVAGRFLCRNSPYIRGPLDTPPIWDPCTPYSHPSKDMGPSPGLFHPGIFPYIRGPLAPYREDIILGALQDSGGPYF